MLVYFSMVLDNVAASNSTRLCLGREGYVEDTAVASNKNIVLTIGYSQNLTLPSADDTPFSWYFSSLIAISVFGIHDAASGNQTNYTYTECKGGKGSKGSNEVMSMLMMHLEGRHDQDTLLTVYADNYGGQNKHNFVAKLFVLQAHVGYFKAIDYKFFIKGHTKNACDRGFGHIRKTFERRDSWVFDHVVETSKDAGVSSRCINVEALESPFSDYKPVVNELYNNIKGLQKFQLFRVERSKAGVVECRAAPDAEPVTFDLKKSYDGTVVSAERALQLLDGVGDVDAPPLNAEKLVHIRKNLFTFVPEEFADDDLYRLPTAVEEADARKIKAQRLKKSEEARDNCEQEKVPRRTIRKGPASTDSVEDSKHEPPAKALKKPSAKRSTIAKKKKQEKQASLVACQQTESMIENQTKQSSGSDNNYDKEAIYDFGVSAKAKAVLKRKRVSTSGSDGDHSPTF